MTFENIVEWSVKKPAPEVERFLSRPAFAPEAEAAAALEKQGRNTMSFIAGALNISVGALTTAVGTLIRKGYLERGSDPDDRRVVRVYPTAAGLAVNTRHEAFHRDMLDQVERVLEEEDLKRLTLALSLLSDFFEQYAKG